jgi:antitoxin component of RelBE/YafQ-DinJ toxin-antitoxin module
MSNRIKECDTDIAFRVPSDLKKEFIEILKNENMPMSIFFRAVIREYINSNRQVVR